MPPRKIRVPKTTKEAIEMIRLGWMFLFKKYPARVGLITAWLAFGGFYYLYNYMSADKVSLGEIKTLGASVETVPSEFSIMPRAYAGMGGGEEIVIDGKKTGYYYNPRYISYITTDGQVFVYDKVSKGFGVPFKLDYPVDYYFDRAKK